MIDTDSLPWFMTFVDSGILGREEFYLKPVIWHWHWPPFSFTLLHRVLTCCNLHVNSYTDLLIPLFNFNPQKWTEGFKIFLQRGHELSWILIIMHKEARGWWGRSFSSRINWVTNCGWGQWWANRVNGFLLLKDILFAMARKIIWPYLAV